MSTDTDPFKPTEEGRKITEKWFLGDLIKAMLFEVKMMPAGLSYGLMTEAQQKDIIERLTVAAEQLTREAVRIISAAQRPHILAELESVMFKDGVKCVVKVGKLNADRYELADAAGGTVLIVLPRTESLLGGEPPKASPNQAGLLDEDGAQP